MSRHKVDNYVSLKAPVTTYKRGRKKRPRVFNINELDGFYVDNRMDRTVHITFEEEDVIIIDIYDTAQAAYDNKGEVVGIIEVNIRTGKAKFFTEGR
jgi:hypothetical protein